MKTETPATCDPADREFDHPLKSIPWFRKLPDTNFVGLILTAVLSIVSGLIFSLIVRSSDPSGDYGEQLLITLVYSFAIGYSIHLMSKVFVPTIRTRLRNKPFVVRLIADMAVWAGGVLMGFAIATTLLGRGFYQPNFPVVAIMIGTVLMSVITGLALRQLALKEIQTEREKAERSEAQRSLALSRLRLLQAQIEPHFLFNTLANVSSLIECDPQQARKMLDQFTLLLRASLDQTRKESTTLRAELQVVEAYLSVLKVRMGDRLSYDVDAPIELQNVSVPAMLLQPIVENAVKHGIEPRVKGGNVSVEVRRENGQLCFAVSDDGVGFVPNGKENIGLGAVRERLAVQFGSAASLEMQRTQEDRTCVTIRIPFPTPAAE